MKLRLGNLADPNEDGQIRDLLSRISMPGGVAIAAHYAPSFREAIEVEGHHPKVIVAEGDGKVQGVALLAHKPVYLNGEIREVGYLSSLRLAPEVRSSTVLARGYKLLSTQHVGIPFSLSAIMEDNVEARELLTSGRASLPHYTQVGGFRTMLIPLIRHSLKLPSGVRILKGHEVGAEKVLECLHRLGKERQFYPAYTLEDLTEPHGLLRGLSIGDFYVALVGDRLVGTFGCWDQTPFRQNVVTRYSPRMKLVKRGFDLLASFTRMAPLPQEGSGFQSLTAACMTAENPEIFRALLRHAINDRRGTGKTFLNIGLFEGDPWGAIAQECFHTTLKSRIYAVEWGEGKTLGELDARVPYLELGAL